MRKIEALRSTRYADFDIEYLRVCRHFPERTFPSPLNGRDSRARQSLHTREFGQCLFSRKTQTQVSGLDPNPAGVFRKLPGSSEFQVSRRSRATQLLAFDNVFFSQVRKVGAANGAGGGIRTHEMPGWKPGAFPLGDARPQMVQGVRVEPTTSRLSIARSAS